MASLNLKTNCDISRGIYVLCLAVIGAFVALNLYNLTAANFIADQIQFESEENLVRNAVSTHLQSLASDQAQVAHNDESVFSLYSGSANPVDVETNIVNRFWRDFKIEHTVIADGNDVPEYTIVKNHFVPSGDGQKFVNYNLDLIQKARIKYFQNRTLRGHGYGIPGHPVWSKYAIYAADFRLVNGRLGVVAAQAVTPSSIAAIPEGNPKIMVSFRPLATDDHISVRNRFGLDQFSILEKAYAPQDMVSMEISDGPGTHIVAAWRTRAPSKSISRIAYPVLVVMSALIFVTLFLFARKYDRIVRDIRRSEEHNRFLAEHDALTGLPNRLQLERELENVVSTGAQDRCAVVCADLDHFKNVNDTYGHLAGDTVIKVTADRIARVVGLNGMVARVGGDEFIILLHEGAAKNDVLALCDSITETVGEEIVFDNGSARVEVSFGIAWWPKGDLTASSVLRAADRALYCAKRSERDKVVWSGTAGGACRHARSFFSDIAEKASHMC